MHLSARQNKYARTSTTTVGMTAGSGTSGAHIQHAQTAVQLQIMKHALQFCLLLTVFVTLSHAQFFPQPSYTRRLFTRADMPGNVPGPEALSDYVVDRSLRLSVQDAVRVAVLNNTALRIGRLDYEATRFTLMRAHQAFDPAFVFSFSPTRSTSPTTSSLEGAQTLSQLTHDASTSYSQTLATGTAYSVGFSSTRTATNNSFVFVNPSFSSSLNFSVTQPLLKNRGRLANRAPIVLAQRARKQSRAGFDAQLNQTIATTINQYWDVVQVREQIAVLKQSLDLAEATYKQNKRALELGALPQLDIYRSESQVAQRKLAVIQAESRAKQLEDQLRQTIGADLDPAITSFDLDLTENAESPDLTPFNLEESLQRAFQKRPELESLRQQLANDDTSIQVSNQNLKPDLSLGAFYTSNGTGGTVLDSQTGAVVSHGGFGSAWDQITGFSYPTYGATLQFRLPLRSSAAAAELGTALSAMRRDLYQLRQRQQSIALEVRNAIHRLEGSSLAVTAAQNSLDLAKQSLAAEQRKYELGAQTIFFVLDAQTQLAQAQQDLLSSHIEYKRALTELSRATGDLPAHYQIEITMQ
jgi:outer membrane protein